MDPRRTVSGTSLAELRHDLRTPVNHIVGYAEMLIEDLEDAGDAQRQAMLADTLGAARDVLTLINSTLSPSRSDLPEIELQRLYESLREPQRKIMRGIKQLLELDAGAPTDTYVDDLQRILQAAERLVPQAEQASRAPRSAATPAVAGQSDAQTPRILVVDDEENNRDVLRRRLIREGYRVDVARNGREALERVVEDPFDLVLLDVMMPEMDGYAVLERMKAAPATHDIPVIVISALDEMQSIVRCIEQGAEDYLPKPFDPVLLRARISASLEKKRLRDQEVEYLRQVDRVIQAALAVESGNYAEGSLGEIAERADALGHLARVFDGMAAQVRARETRLREQVTELRREIEVARASGRFEEVDNETRDLRPGDRLSGRYEIVSVVGFGGMGTVYHARDLELDESVAIKTLRPDLVADPTVIERFKSEIKLARRISHRNVVRTHDLGEVNGTFYLTMEFVEGITVRELLDTRGKLGLAPTLAIARQLADSLTVAHEQGVIHRDIKPQNLLLDAEGVLKVMDFGVARLALRSSGVTEAGLLVGTPYYMSPEQLMSEEIDHRTDLYATGVVLYECVTGELPFDASSAVGLIAKVLSLEPDEPIVRNPEVPQELNTLILQLLAKRPDERVQTAAELSVRLAQLA